MPARLNYLGVAADLAARIGAGEYVSGSRLPSYRQLAELYSVSISTVSRAVLLLRERGLIRGEHGVGIFVV